MYCKATLVNLSFTLSMSIRSVYCLIIEFSGSTRIRIKSSSVRFSSSTIIGKRPTNSGIIPCFTRSFASNLCLFGAAFVSIPVRKPRFFSFFFFHSQRFKSTTANKQNIRCINFNSIALRMFSSSMCRNRDCGSFHNLKKCLLNTFTGNISGDRNPFFLLRWVQPS